MRRLFGSPIFVGFLVLVAIVMVVRSVLFAPGRRSSSGSASPRTEPVATKVVPQLTATAASTNLPPGVPMDLREILRIWETAGQVSAVARDPFYRPDTNAVAVATNAPPPAKDRLKLSAIWDQSGSGRAAVLNGRVVKEGDKLLGFEVKSIQRREVILMGPSGEERLQLGIDPPKRPVRVQK